MHLAIGDERKLPSICQSCYSGSSTKAGERTCGGELNDEELHPSGSKKEKRGKKGRIYELRRSQVMPVDARESIGSTVNPLAFFSFPLFLSSSNRESIGSDRNAAAVAVVGLHCGHTVCHC